jgi:hypothetical protein
MTFDEKKELALFAFFGKDLDGKRLGVYVEKSDDRKFDWYFTIKGVLGERFDHLPIEKHEARGLLGIEDDSYNPFTGMHKQETLSICRTPPRQ